MYYFRPEDIAQQQARVDQDYLFIETFVLDWIWPHRDRRIQPTCVLDILRTYATLRLHRLQKQRWEMHIPDITSGQIAGMLKKRLHHALWHRGQDVEFDALLSQRPELPQVIVLYAEWLKRSFEPPPEIQGHSTQLAVRPGQEPHAGTRMPRGSSLKAVCCDR